MMPARLVFGALLAVGLMSCQMLSAIAQHGQLQEGTLELRATTTIPFKLSGDHIYVPVRIGNADYSFIFDTGGTAILTPEVAHGLSLPVVGKAQVHGAGATAQDADLVQVPEIHVGAASYKGGTFIVLDLPFIASTPFPGKRFGGIIGREFFKHLVTTIDYQDSKLTFSQPALFHADPQAVALSLSLRHDIPNVPASLDGHEGNFDVDAGSAQGLTLTQAFSDSSNVLKDAGSTVEVIQGRAIGGVVMGTAARAKLFTIGTIQLRNPVVIVAHSTGGAFGDPSLSGNIGARVLKRFTLTVDIPDSKLYLRANKTLGDAFPFNRSGIFSEAAQKGETIALVVPGSPAEQAGIRTGDVIAALDGTTATKLLHDNITAMWERPAGTKVRATLLRDGKSREAVIELRDLL